METRSSKKVGTIGKTTESSRELAPSGTSGATGGPQVGIHGAGSASGVIGAGSEVGNGAWCWVLDWRWQDMPQESQAVSMGMAYGASLGGAQGAVSLVDGAKDSSNGVEE
ncbi:unnamed protein product [Ilex paraguariensis]|uniref:Uncharacterized protein n=1 Tax=Ilex paraguariensis TaxID=185542 RepID=A0ABC8UEU3_9AQUA